MRLETGGFNSISVGGLPFAAAGLDDATKWILENCRTQGGVAVRLANAYSVALANNQESYGVLLATSGINFADGTPVAGYMDIRSGSTKRHRVRGPSLFVKVLDEGRGTQIRHQLIGATDSVIRDLEEAVRRRFPGVYIVDSFAPPFAEVDDNFISSIARRIGDAKPDIVWIALGTPKQDFVTALLAQDTRTMCIGIGAAFDFVAGSVSEAPEWMQRSGLEWVHRLAAEPRRLWRRYLFGNIRFITSLAKPARHLRRISNDK